MRINKKQRKALHAKWLQNNNGMSYLQFRRSILLGSFDCIMVNWCGMWLGIETDGYTHS